MDHVLTTVGGGKPKMKYYFNTERAEWPSSVDGAPPEGEEAQSALVDRLQDQKTVFYKEIVESTAEARPGVLRLMDEALDRTDYSAKPTADEDAQLRDASGGTIVPEVESYVSDGSAEASRCGNYKGASGSLGRKVAAVT